jgi:hypothetical protein
MAPTTDTSHAVARGEHRHRHLRIHRLIVEEDEVWHEREELAAHVAQQLRGAGARARGSPGRS